MYKIKCIIHMKDVLFLGLAEPVTLIDMKRLVLRSGKYGKQYLNSATGRDRSSFAFNRFYNYMTKLWGPPHLYTEIIIIN